MIIEYYRPKTLEEALELLSRTDLAARPLGGGTALTRPSPDHYVAVDLQDLGLDDIQARGKMLSLGATVTLQRLQSIQGIPRALVEATRHEATYNLRQVATVAGTLVACDGRSSFTTVMLALDARLLIHPGEEQTSLGDLLHLRSERLHRRLITNINIPLNADLAYAYVARSPADQPIVCVGAARWPSGRTRLAIGGYGETPMMVFDGTEPSGAETAASDAYSHAGDEWASADYRREIVSILTRRCLKELNNGDRK